MANMGRTLQFIIIGLVFAFDYSQGRALAGFVLAGYYLATSLYALITKDRIMFKKRGFLFAVFFVEILIVAAVVESPPDLGFLDRWVQKLAK